jgi:hypothetical protein
MPDDVEAPKRRLQASEAQRDLLELMVAKLKVQLARRNRTLYGTSTERFDAAQGSLIEAALLDELASRKAASKPAANKRRSTAACRRTCRVKPMSTGQRPPRHITTPRASPVAAVHAAAGTATLPIARVNIHAAIWPASRELCKPTPMAAGAASTTAAGSLKRRWAHARRPWLDLYIEHGRDDSSLAAQALRRIQALYAIEADVRGQPPDIRRRHRQARAGPLLVEFNKWLHAMLAQVSTSSELAKAARYSLARWSALTRYGDDGRIEIDNWAAERALRGVALGRNNYLFMGSDDGGERAASLYSLLETAMLNGPDPEGYLRDALARIGEHPINRVDELLPWNIAGQQLRKAA